MTRDAAALEVAYGELIDQYPEAFAPIIERLGTSLVKKAMHVLIRREQEGDSSVTPMLDRFDALRRAAAECDIR